MYYQWSAGTLVGPKATHNYGWGALGMNSTPLGTKWSKSGSTNWLLGVVTTFTEMG